MYRLERHCLGSQTLWHRLTVRVARITISKIARRIALAALLAVVAGVVMADADLFRELG